MSNFILKKGKKIFSILLISEHIKAKIKKKKKGSENKKEIKKQDF